MKVKELFEGYKGDWAILPATMELYGKRTVDLVTAASTWEDYGETILICKNEDDRTCFIGSGGDSFEHYSKDIGKSFSTYHDQTGASKGRYKVINVVYLKDGEILKKANDIDLKAKASLAVFK
jgi:exopolysaccharide biosynthesis predicted pyruvyltransferase EpsI